jgi:hypothetical protein
MFLTVHIRRADGTAMCVGVNGWELQDCCSFSPRESARLKRRNEKGLVETLFSNNASSDCSCALDCIACHIINGEETAT